MNNEAQTKLHKALIKAVAETKDVHADDYNPHFKSKFASLKAHLEVIKPIFAKHGLAVIQIPMSQDGMVGISTKVIHEDGGILQEFVGIDAKDLNGQHAGAAISYLRRYALAAVAGVATEDDDANSAIPTPSRSTSSSAPSTYQKPSAKPVAAASSSDNGNPHEVQIHFGKNKGVRLGDLNEKQLQWYNENYKAEGYQGKPPRKEDIALRNALDQIFGNAPTPKASSEEDDDAELDEVPF